MIVAADPPPPLVRSVLSTNLPPFGLTGQALFRTANLPYLDWSNIVQQVIDTNAFQPASTILTNLSNTGALTNPAAFQPSSTTLSNLAGTGALTNSGAFIASSNGLGTNTTLRGSVGYPSNSVYILTNGWIVVQGTNTSLNVNEWGYLWFENKNTFQGNFVMMAASNNAPSNVKICTESTNGLSHIGINPGNVLSSPFTFRNNFGTDFRFYIRDTNEVVTGDLGSCIYSGTAANNPGMNFVIQSGTGKGIVIGSWLGNINFAGTNGIGNGPMTLNINSDNDRATKAIRIRKPGTTYDNWSISNALGEMLWSDGTGSTAPDVGLKRSAINMLKVTDIGNNAGSITASNIISQGRVGAGTNSPQSALHVTGDNSVPLVAQFGTTNIPQMMVIDTNGNIGFGTNNPQAKFDFFAQSNGPSQYILRVANGMVANASNTLVINTNNNTVVGGKLGIGTGDTAPTQPLSFAPATGTKISFYNGLGYTLTVNAGEINMATPDTLPSNTGFTWTHGGVERMRLNGGGMLGIGTNAQIAWMDVIGDNSTNLVLRAGTTNRTTLLTLITNGNMNLAGAFSPTNGIINQGSASSIANITITTNSTQIWCLNGTNQLVTLPDCTKVPAYQIYRFSSTNGNSIVIFTNATGTQTIRDGTSLSMEHIGVGEVGFFTDGAAWFLSSKTKTIWPNASWSTSTNVPLTVAGSNYVTYNQLETSNGQGISLTNGYQIYVRDFGQYLFTFSIVTQIGAPNATNRIWLQQSGQNVPRTRTDVKMSSTAEQYVMTVNFILPVTTNLTWFGLCVRSTDTGAQLVTGAAADATMPAMPSAIVTVNKISDTFP